MIIPNSPKRQKGAAILITLILLLVSTILGLSVMRDATQEQQLVSNVFFKELSFRGAESASQKIINDTQLLAAALEPSNHANGLQESVQLPNANVVSGGEIRYAGKGIARGFSLGSSSAAFQVYKFNLSGTAEVIGVSATTTIVQGVNRLAPAQ